MYCFFADMYITTYLSYGMVWYRPLCTLLHCISMIWSSNSFSHMPQVFDFQINAARGANVFQMSILCDILYIFKIGMHACRLIVFLINYTITYIIFRPPTHNEHT